MLCVPFSQVSVSSTVNRGGDAGGLARRRRSRGVSVWLSAGSVEVPALAAGRSGSRRRCS